jgi:hypothetical protein
MTLTYDTLMVKGSRAPGGSRYLGGSERLPTEPRRYSYS